MLSIRALGLSAACALGATNCFAQAAAPATAARSHVERFSTPTMRAERVEAEAGVRLAADHSDAEALNLRGLARMQLGRFNEAHEDLRRAVSLRPQESRYRANLGYALWRLGRPEEAVESERAALSLDEKNFTAHRHLGLFLLRLGGRERLEEAVARLRRALELNPLDYEVRFDLIDAYRALGDVAQASAQLELLRDARPSDARAFYTGGLLAADRDDLTSSVREFKEALRRDPTLLRAWRDLGLAHAKAGRWPEAVEAFSELSRRQSNSVEAAYLHALSLFNAGQAADAERESRRALRLNAGAAEAHTLLGVILAARGETDAEAAESLAQAVALSPDSFDARFYLGRVLYGRKDFGGAVENLRAAVRLRPRHAEARFFLGTALESAGDARAALSEYEELSKLDPDSVFGRLGRGALFVKQGKFEEAITLLRGAASADPKNFEAHLALGRALSLGGRLEEAAGVLRTAVSLAPRRADAHYQLGLALRRLGRADEAAREFAIVDKLNTEFRTGAGTKP